MRLGRNRFAPVVRAQLDLFAREQHDLIVEVGELLAVYDRGDRDDAEERFGDYQDAIDAARQALESMRDHYASTLDEPADYVRAFDRAATRRWPRLAPDRGD